MILIGRCVNCVYILDLQGSPADFKSNLFMHLWGAFGVLPECENRGNIVQDPLLQQMRCEEVPFGDINPHTEVVLQVFVDEGPSGMPVPYIGIKREPTS